MSITHTAHPLLAPARDSAPAGGGAPSAMASALANALGLGQGAAPADHTPADAVTATERSAAPRESRPRDERHANGPRGPRGNGNGARRGNTRGGPRAPQGDRPARPERPAPRPTNPVLVQLAELYPALFGDVALPLKRGVFQDLMAAHPEVFEKAALKEALGQHTRSTRYLKAMSDNLPRHDLQGQPVEALAAEHAYHALLEVFKRRHARTGEDVRAALQTRMLQMLDASGLHRDDFAQRVRTKDEAAGALLDAVLAHAHERAAKDEALHRAHAGSGMSVEDFASSYGMDAATVAQALARAALVPLPASDSVETPVSAPSTATEAPSAEADAAGNS